jgi:hypothetical protein
VKETPPLPRCVCCGLRPTPLVVQSSDSRWKAAPHLPQAPDHTNHPDRSDSALPAKDDRRHQIGLTFEKIPNTSQCSLPINKRVRNLRSPTRRFWEMRNGKEVVCP